MDGFWIGAWHHDIPRKAKDRIEIIRNLCFGPLETYIVGIHNNQYFREIHEIEPYEDTYFKYISKEEFVSELDNEIRLCLKYNVDEQAEILKSYRENIDN